MTKDTPKYIWPITVTTDRYRGGFCEFLDDIKTGTGLVGFQVVVTYDKGIDIS